MRQRQLFRPRRRRNQFFDGFYPEFKNHLRVRPLNRTSVAAAVITFALSITYGLAPTLFMADPAPDSNVEETTRNYRDGNHHPRSFL
jgi:hypothetical protein